MDIRNEAEAVAAFEKISKNLAGLSVTEMAFLIQEMVKGKREFVVGLVRDNQFGPVVMFGIGGIFTEIISDVVFRLVPFTHNEALKMIKEIKGRKMLDAIRGMEPVELNLIAKILVSLGDIALEHPEIQEIDINPLLVSRGIPIAVDGLITLA